ncbi:MAG: murein hydrolase activator EnvC family protein [Alphaproteobacteria bacterium]
MKFLGVSFLALFSWGALAATPTTQDLKLVESELQKERQAERESKLKASQLERELKEVQRQLVSSAKQIQSQEGRLSLLEQKTKELELQEADLKEKLKLSNKQLFRIMKGLQTLALRPTELLIFQSKKPVDMLRSRDLMRYSLPIIGQMQAETKENLAKLANVRQELSEKKEQTKQTHTDLLTQREKMNRLAGQKKVMQAQYTTYYNEAKKKADALAAKAQDLKDLLTNLEHERALAKKKQEQRLHPAPRVAAGAFGKAKGLLALPANGLITQHFGDSSISGAHAKGIVIKTRPNAQITVPFDGTVLFAGPFQNYGRLLIVDHGDEYLTVLAGMDAINACVGQELLAGEPVGTMGNVYIDLYLEVRSQGTPEDPEEWFKRRER